MFCRKCGKVIPDDSTFCPSCGTQNTVEINAETGKISLAKPVVNPTNSNLVLPDMICRSCKKQLTVFWEKCPYCNVPNPFYIPQKQSTPQPQVIIKEEKIIVREEKKPEEKGCGALICEAIGGFITVCLFLGLLQSCLGG